MSVLPTKLALHEPERHVVLEAPAWNPDAAKSAIQEIVDDAAGRFDADQFWQSHHPAASVRDYCSGAYSPQVSRSISKVSREGFFPEFGS